MLIVCPTCATSYQVEPSSLGATGRSVRCVRCQKVWFAANTEAMAAISLFHHQDMSAFSTDSPGDLTVSAAAEPSAEDVPHVLDDAPAEPPSDQPPAEELVRDDRGSAPLPEPRQYDLPPEPVAVDDAPPLAPSDPASTPQGPVDPVPENIESVAARRIKRSPARRRQRWPVPRWSAAILLLVAINIGLIGWRADVVRLLPQTASIYAAIGLEVNLRGLVFTDLGTRKETEDGVPMLVVEGVIKSTGKSAIDVPRIRFAVRNAKGHEIYSWSALPRAT